MKKFSLSAFLLILISIGGFVSAHSFLSEEELAEITLNDLGLTRVGLLPTSPLYFLKEWSRGLSRFFTFNSLAKAELELRLLNERAGEIIVLGEASAPNLKGLERALANYRQNVSRLEKRLTVLSRSSENPNVDALLERLTDRFVKHGQLFDGLKADEVQEETAKILADAVNRLDGPERFHERLEQVFDNHKKPSALQNLRLIAFLERLQRYLNEAAKSQVRRSEEELLVRLNNRIKNFEQEDLRELFFNRLKILDEVRERTEIAELKTQLNLTRQQILEEAAKTGVTEERAQELISAAENIFSELEQKINSKNLLISKSAEELAERAKFNLEQAKVAQASGNYGAAFGQASAAAALANNALIQLRSSWGDFEAEIKNLKERFDRLNPGSFSEDERLQSEFETIEDLLINLSEMLKKRISVDKVSADLNRARKLLIELEEVL